MDGETKISNVGQPISRYKISFSNFPFLKDNNYGSLQVLENYLENFSFPEMSIDIREDVIQGQLNLLPAVPNDVTNFNENNLTLTFLADENRKNYLMFLRLIRTLIRKTKDFKNMVPVESVKDFFIDNIIIDMYDNQGDPKVINSLYFENCLISNIGNLSMKAEKQAKKFDVGLRYERFDFNDEKMDMIKQYE